MALKPASRTKAKTEVAADKPTKKAAKAASIPAAKEAARILSDEETRRANAIARIRSAAEAAGIQKARMGIFMQRLQARVDRSAERITSMVEAERGRQAKVLEKHPELKQLNGTVDLDAAAAIPEVEITESELPAYITNIKDE